MNPARRSLISLAVILISVAATAVAWRLRPPPPPPPAEESSPLFDFPAAAVRALDVRAPRSTLRAERRDGAWVVVAIAQGGASATPEPVPTPTSAEVNGVLTILVRELAEAPRIDRFPLAGRSPAEFGLDRPRATIAFTLDDGREVRLEIGAATLTGAALYARVIPSDDVSEVGGLLFTTIDAAMYRLRGLEAGAPAAPEAGAVPAGAGGAPEPGAAPAGAPEGAGAKPASPPGVLPPSGPGAG